MNNRNLSFFNYISQLITFADQMRICAAVLGAFWILDALFFVSDSPNRLRYVYLYFGVVLFVIGLFSLHSGYKKTKATYDFGIEILGKIVNIYFHLGYGLITCEYLYQGRICRSSQQVSKSQKVRKLTRGQEIMLIMDRNDPKQVLIRGFYQ